MTHDDILKMLDIAPVELPQSAAGAYDVPTSPPSPTALKLGEWDRRRGEEVLYGSDRLSNLLIGDQVEASYDDCNLVADFHAAAFEPSPVLADTCKNERLREYVKNLLETPEYAALHKETQLDMAASEIATAAFAEAWIEDQHKELKPDSPEELAGIRSLRAVGSAIRAAQKEVSELRDMQGALGVGSEAGVGSTPLCDTIANIFRRIRESDQLRSIINLAGRYRRLASALQASKTTHGCDDVVGVELDGDLARVLPHELGMLNDEDLELDVLRRLVERQMLCREWSAVESEVAGPVVLVVDESGSMKGLRIAQAKAIALAMMWIANHQGRWCCLVGFSNFTDGGNYLVVPPGSRRDTELFAWLEHFYNGGTSIEIPLLELPNKWVDLVGKQRGRTDMVLITDAVLMVSKELSKSFLSWKEAERVRLQTIVLASGCDDTLRNVSDSVHVCTNLGLEQDCVRDALSI